MNIQLRKLLGETAQPVSETAAFDFTGRDFGHFTVKAPVHTAFTATPQHGLVKLDLRVDTTVTAECARCLEDFSFPFTAEKQYVIREEDLTDEFPELPFAPDGSLDMEEMAYQELVLETPAILVCSEGCEGLCQQCGKPAAVCQCAPAPQGDARLQILKQLLTDD